MGGYAALQFGLRYPEKTSAMVAASVGSGSSDRQIAAVLGHSTMKQVAIYVAQAQQRLLARGAQQKRDEMYEKEELETLIDLAGNVVKLRA
jgi:pimeloyl-ACP methyl ester carboxylesterase